MKTIFANHNRPAMWGFFISLALTGTFLCIRFLIPTIITLQWNTHRYHARAEQLIQVEFKKRIEHLSHIAGTVSKDIWQLKKDSSDERRGRSNLFRALDGYQRDNNQTLDLLDSLGNLIAWRGPSITSNYSQLIEQRKGTHFVRLSRNGLHIYITAGVQVGNGRYVLLVSEPFELNSPISNRFVRQMSFSNDLSKMLESQVRLNLAEGRKTRAENEFIVPLYDQNNNFVADVYVTEQTLANTIARWYEFFTILVNVCLSTGSFCLALLIFLSTRKRYQYWIVSIISLISLWGVRIIWQKGGFPSDIIGGWLFSPNVFASRFVFGLSSSLGDLTLSVIAVAITTFIILKGSICNKQSEKYIGKLGPVLRRGGVLVFGFISVLLILWLFRGFGEALRSFVFDSTVEFDNPSEILLDYPTIVIHFNILVLCSSILGLSLVLLWMVRELLRTVFSLSRTYIRFLLAAVVCCTIPFFVLLDDTQTVSLLHSILFLIMCTALLEFTDYWKRTIPNDTLVRYRLMIWSVMVSFLVGIPMLHQKLNQKEEKEIEVIASELTRSSDSWLAFVVLDGLRSSVENNRRDLTFDQISSAKENNLAFVLWANTLLGKEGFNSALLLYDPQGNEVDRFVVGMSKQEQRDMLIHIFDGEENAVHILDQSLSGRTAKLYGGWSTVRDSSDRLIGSIALLLLENRVNLFQEERIEPLRQVGVRFANESGKEIAIHEYRQDTLVYSTGQKLYPIQILPQAMKREFVEAQNSFLWKSISINSKKTKTLFYKDISLPNRMIAISVEELDFRWDLFRALKASLVYLVIAVLLGAFIVVQQRDTLTYSIIGFREKLFLGIIVITLIPLIVLSYYNRQLVTEQSRERVELVLHNELTQIQDRINSYVLDEEDYIKGVDDDFCEALATEYRTEFTLYKNSNLHASSRSELYRADLLNSRLGGNVFTSIMLGNRNFVFQKETIGSFEYIVGYAPLFIGGRKIGVLAIPTINRQREIESELAQRNAYLFGAYAVVFAVVFAGGVLLALRFTRPLRELTRAAKEVSQGDLNVHIDVQSRDEIGVLTHSFNEMVKKVRLSRIELAKHERESAWKEMAKQIAHEIRNPLTPIKLSIQHLRQAFKDKAQNRDEILQRVTQTVIDQIDTLSRIATEFSHFAKLPESKYERLNLDTILQDTINLFREVAGITFRSQLQSSSEMIVADRDQLRGVFINIIRNAIQAIEKSGTIAIESCVEGSVCIIRISDTGHGIPDEIRQKIFEPNFSTKTEGMGLGLAIARRIIEDHGGTISCSSEIGKGTIFEIRLPK